MVENSHPLQMANDAKIKKWFPNKAQIQGIAKKNMVQKWNWECDYKTFNLYLRKISGNPSVCYSFR